MVEEIEMNELSFGENDDQNGGDAGEAEQDVDEGEPLNEDGHHQHHHHHYHEHKLY